jgi:hypothetical protein
MFCYNRCHGNAARYFGPNGTFMDVLLLMNCCKSGHGLQLHAHSCCVRFLSTQGHAFLSDTPYAMAMLLRYFGHME